MEGSELAGGSSRAKKMVVLRTNFSDMCLFYNFFVCVIYIWLLCYFMIGLCG